MDSNNLKNMILAGINRFLTEMPPFWTTSQFERMLSRWCLSAKDELVISILKDLSDSGVIDLSKDETIAFYIKPEYLDKNLPSELIELYRQELNKIKIQNNK